jgi:hypothetical protein
MTAPLATCPSKFDRSAFFFHLTEPAHPDESSAEFTMENTGEDATVRLQHLAELVSSECVPAEAMTNACEETSTALAQRITLCVRQRRIPDDRDFASLRLLDCALDAQRRGQKAYVVRQVWLALSLYGNR